MGTERKSTVPATLLACLLVSIAPAQAALAQSTKAKAAPGKTAVPTPPPTAAVEVARVGFFQGVLEVLKPGGGWVVAVEDQPLSAGDRIRTSGGGTAQLEFPWTVVSMGERSEISIEKNRQLTLQIESGRVDVDPEDALLRIVTAEASISGAGRTVVRREGTTTFVGSSDGGAMVESLGTSVRLGVNKGTIVKANSVPEPATPLGPAPRVVSPASDPRFVQPDQNVRLTWTAAQPWYHLEILPIDSDVAVLSFEVEGTELDVRIPWLGTYRWRVAGRTGPVETQLSSEGLICVVDK